MARFREFCWFPYSGWYAQTWGDGASASRDVDAAARSARRVTEEISRRLAQLGLTAPRSAFKVNTDDVAGRDVVYAPSWFAGESFLGHVGIPAGFRYLSPDLRAASVAEVTEAALLVVAREAGWDEQLVKDAVQGARDTSFTCDWVGPWRTTRDRKTKVRVQGRIEDDGYARWRIAVADADSETPRLTSEEILGWTWLANMADASKSMRFLSPTLLKVVGGSQFLPVPLEVDLETGRVQEDAVQPDDSPKRPWTVRSEPTQYPGDPERVPSLPAVVILSAEDDGSDDGMSDSGMSRVQLNVVERTSPPDMPTWRRAVSRYASHIWNNRAEWNQWWSPSGREELEIWLEVASEPEAGPPRSMIRAGKTRCTGRFTRVNEPTMSPAAQVRAAERNVRAILDQAAQRLQLPAYPPLPAATDVAAALKVADDKVGELAAFIESMGDRLPEREVVEMLELIAEGSDSQAHDLLALWIIDGHLELSSPEHDQWDRLRATDGERQS